MQNGDIHYLFVDDNENNESSRLLQKFSKDTEKVFIHKQNETTSYECNDNTHHWNEHLIWKVAGFKNMMIQFALKDEYDYLFLIDSDLILHPATLESLIKAKKDIISEVFWTKWQPHFPELPQVWLFDQYEQYPKKRNESLTSDELTSRHRSFIEQIKIPGVYEVGGLGACTLISKNALQAGVNFEEIKNVSFWGEDRHFCIRAAALGFKLYVDTNYPAYHIYRESDLNGIPQFGNKESEGTKSKNYEVILNRLTEGIESLGTFNYINGYKRDWSVFFEGNLKLNLVHEALSTQTASVENKLIVKATVHNAVMKSEDNEHVTYRFNLVNDGIEAGKSFYDRFTSEATLINMDGKWLISNFVINAQSD